MSADRACRRYAAAIWLLQGLLLIAPAAVADEEPDPLFLEFLATWDAEDEDWFDAMVDSVAGTADATQRGEHQPRVEANDDEDN